MSKKILLHEDIFLMLSFRRFIVLALAFRSLVDLKLIFVCGVRQGLEFIFSLHDYLVALCIPFQFLLAKC